MADQKGELPVVVHMDIRKLKPEPIEEAIVDAYTEQEQTKRISYHAPGASCHAVLYECSWGGCSRG